MSDTTAAPDPERLAERLAAVERRLTADTAPDDPVADVGDRTELASRIDELETTVSELETALEDVEAGLQAVRGYVGGVRAVDREVERRADLALARTDRIERALDADGETLPKSEAHPDGVDDQHAEFDGATPGSAAVEAAIPDRDPRASDDGKRSTSEDDSEDVLARLRRAL